MRHVWKVYCVHGIMELSQIRVFLGLDKNFGVAQEMVQNAARVGNHGLERELRGGALTIRNMRTRLFA